MAGGPDGSPGPGDVLASGDLHSRDRAASALTGHASYWPQHDPELFGLAEVLGWWSEALAPGAPPRPVRVYVSFPFCAPQCRYCMYWRLASPGPGGLDTYVDHLCRLVGRYRETVGPVEARSAYFGGGTPSLLGAAQLGRVLEAFRGLVSVRSDFTSEANPSSLDGEKLALLASAGVNRLSLGVQALDPEVLRAIGRVSEPVDVVARLVAEARRLGMFVNVDLVAGLPAQDARSFASDFKSAVGLQADELTVYRYQPVRGLAIAPASSMALPALMQDLRGEADAGGYDLSVVTDDSFGAKLYRRAPRHADHPGAARGFEYSLFDEPSAHLLGLGSGAYSHVFGRAWFRDATSPRAGLARRPTTYVGSRMSAEDECRTRLLALLADGSRVEARSILEDTGVDLATAFGEALRAGLRDGALVGTLDSFGAARPPRQPALERVTAALLPVRPQRRDGPALPAGVDPVADLEPALVPFSLAGPAGAPPSGATAGPSPLAQEWLEVVGLTGAGARLGPAEVASVSGGIVRLRVLGAPLELELEISPPSPGTPAFCRTRRFAFAYRRHGNPELSARERRVLEELARRTESAERANG